MEGAKLPSSVSRSIRPQNESMPATLKEGLKDLIQNLECVLEERGKKDQWSLIPNSRRFTSDRGEREFGDFVRAFQ